MLITVKPPPHCILPPTLGRAFCSRTFPETERPSLPVGHPEPPIPFPSTVINPSCPAHVLPRLLKSIVSGLYDPLVNTDKNQCDFHTRGRGTLKETLLITSPHRDGGKREVPATSMHSEAVTQTISSQPVVPPVTKQYPTIKLGNYQFGSYRKHCVLGLKYLIKCIQGHDFYI